MSNRITQLCLASLFAGLSGCAMCGNPYDCQYAAYGSRLPRADMVNGRVGSILDGATGGIVTTEPLINEGTIVDESYGTEILGESYGAESYGEGEVIYGEPQPIESDSMNLYESPGSYEVPPSSSIEQMPAIQQMPAVEQMDQVYEAIEGEINP